MSKHCSSHQSAQSRRVPRIATTTKSLQENETDLIANMANISSALKKFQLVVGWFYLVKGMNWFSDLFGDGARTRIGFGKGCVREQLEKNAHLKTNVNEFRHISAVALQSQKSCLFLIRAVKFLQCLRDSERFDMLDKLM